MKIRLFHIILLLIVLPGLSLNGQPDKDPPETPVMNLVTVDPSTGNVDIQWSPSSSPDVSGYVVYLFQSGEGYVLDTLYDPAATSYLRTGSGSNYESESFVVAAIDTAGNISPLSNELSTIFITAQIDTCKNEITISWNSYNSFPRQVINYTLFSSVNSGDFREHAQADPGLSNIIFNDFEADAQYCFIIRAGLNGGLFSGSNKTCLVTDMQKPPAWINADYASAGPGEEILLSFTIDPRSEINTFKLERKTGYSGIFSQIDMFNNIAGNLLYNDNNADPGKVNFYRLTAVNNCGLSSTVSNISSNLVLSLERYEDEIRLSWNPYREWEGIIGEYKVFAMTGQVMEEIASLTGTDTIYDLNYGDIMYEVSRNEICFRVDAIESSNPYGSHGISKSKHICTPVSEKITVPTLFTPDNNSMNDYFRPVLSFTPLSYKLVITDLKRKIVFESNDHSEEWDGTRSGDPLPGGVYLWFLQLRTPSGKDLTRSGTVTIMHNR